MQSGSYLEFNAGNDCILYTSKGEMITKVRSDGAVSLFSAGENKIRFSSDIVDGPAPCVKLTAILYGKPLWLVSYEQNVAHGEQDIFESGCIYLYLQ